MRQVRARGEMQMDLQAKLTTIASNIIKIAVKELELEFEKAKQN